MQCMHWRFTNTDFTPPAPAGTSRKMTRVKLFESRWRGLLPDSEKPLVPASSSFQLLQATWQPRHPMQRVVSINIPLLMPVRLLSAAASDLVQRCADPLEPVVPGGQVQVEGGPVREE